MAKFIDESRLAELWAKIKVLFQGVVPTTREINGKALSEDVTLTAADVGALSKGGGTMTGHIDMGKWNITNVRYLSVGAVGATITVNSWTNSLSITPVEFKFDTDMGVRLAIDNTEAGFRVPLNMYNKKITGLAAPTADTDAATKKYVDDNAGSGGDFMADGSVPMTGTLWVESINSGTYELNIGPGESYGELHLGTESNPCTVYTHYDLDMNGNNILNLKAPVSSTDATPRSYVDAGLSGKLSLTGGTITGDVNMTSALYASNVTAPAMSCTNLTAAGHIVVGTPEETSGSVVLASGTAADDAIYITNVSGPNEGILQLFCNPTEDVILRGVNTPVTATDVANKAYVDNKTLVFAGKPVATSAWVSNNTYSAQGYNWRAQVVCAGVTASHRPDVAFGAADAVGGNFAPVVDSYAGGVYIYCKTKPTATITIPSIVCLKGV